MSDFSVINGVPATEKWGAVPASSAGTAISAATANTYGSWVELTASSGINASGLILTADDPNGGNEIDIDIGVGSAGSEVVVADCLFVRPDSYARAAGFTYQLPLNIKAGSRVAARMKSAAASRNIQVSVLALGGTMTPQSFDKMTSLAGAGVYAVTTGYSANTKGAWNQIVSSTAATYKALHLVWGILDYTSSNSAGLFDLAIGGSGSEVIIASNLHATAYSLSGVSHNAFQQAVIYGSVPAGSRLAFRGQVTAGSSSRYLVMSVHGYS